MAGGAGDGLFDDFDDVTVVVLTDNLDEEILRVDDPRRLAALGAWLAERTDGWSTPPGAARVAALRLNLFAGKESRGHLGAGNRVLTVHRRGGFVQRDWTPHERRDLFHLLGTVDPRDVER